MTHDEVTARIERALEGTDWHFKFYDIKDSGESGFLFETWSPAGEDLPIEGEVLSPETALAEIEEMLRQLAYDYDAEEHAEGWIEMRGKHGVPDSIRVLLDDAEAIGEMFQDLYERIKKEVCHA